MTIGIKLGQITDEIGSSEFLYCFFSTIAVNLEPAGWGSRFPAIMKGLYSGKLPSSDAEAALIELRSIKFELSKISPKNVVWSYEDRDIPPPWGNDISKDITSLENYFVTSSGRELIPLLEEVLVEASEQNNGNTIVEIVKY
ncbi:Imm70 family immunity protein [Pseudomonas monteilii]|uniref:Imm70 family immunity protein n=1 Tax=Pseudomonas monteilii TaxID=76759 RepID=UPI000760DC94|nr:Imm70 family immunity protein [Pseudomonas monteilii]